MAQEPEKKPTRRRATAKKAASKSAQAKGGGGGAKPKRQPPRLTATQRAKRDREIWRDRRIAGLSWSSMAQKWKLSVSALKAIVRQVQAENPPSPADMVDPNEEMTEYLEDIDTQSERIRDWMAEAAKDRNWTGVAGFEAMLRKQREERLSKLQETERMPKVLGVLKIEGTLRMVADEVAAVVEKYAAEIPPSMMDELEAALHRAMRPQDAAV